MKTEELVGQKIRDIRIKTSPYEYEGSIPLRISEGVIELENGFVFSLPFRFSDEVEPINNPNYKGTSIFILPGFISRLFNTQGLNIKVIRRNIKNIQNKKITGIYKFIETDEINSYSEIGQRIILEMETGFLIGEIEMAPMGTGHAGIWIFTSIGDLEKKFGKGFKKVFPK